MASQVKQPEVYWTKPNDHCPNSHLPVLVYRNVLPEDLTPESASNLFDGNGWWYDQCWSHTPRAHFHTNTHECYAALKGRTTCLYGVGPLDDQSEGVIFHMNAGDIAVHAAGVSHKNLESTDDYLFMGVYPKESPPYDNHGSIGTPEETKMKTQQAKKVPIPNSDPIYGFDGPLPAIWNEASVASL